MANLPNDIIVDILLKLPIRSLLRFKCVCKQWRSLISDPGFVKLHLNKENRQRLLLVSTFDTLYSIDYESPVVNNGLVAVKVDLPMPVKIQCFETVGYCDGLLCLLINEKSIALCNPSTREFHELPCPPGEIIDPFIYGFGYDSSIDDYKVIKGFKVQGENRMEILELKTNTWRKIQNLDYHYVGSPQRGGLVNGAIHWIAGSYTDGFKIVGLDLVEEKLFEVPQPDHNNTNLIRHQYLQVLGGCLCLARLQGFQYYEIWLMKEYGVCDTWTKLISYQRWRISNPILNLVPLCFMSNREILVGTSDEKLFIYNLDEKTFKDFEICNVPSFWCLQSYKESLVSPNKNLISPNEGNFIEINHISEGRREARNWTPS